MKNIKTQCPICDYAYKQNGYWGCYYEIPPCEMINTATSQSYIICPVCGKPMDETYHGRQYCEECKEKLRKT